MGPIWLQNHCVQDTLNLSTCSNSSTNGLIPKKKICHMSHVIDHVLYAECHMSPVTNM